MADYWQLEESADQWQLEESTDLWLLEGTAFVENAGDGAWFQNVATGVARAVGAAALALSAGLAHGIHQQADDLPRADLIAGNESVQVVAIGRDPLPKAFVYDDDIVPQPAAAALDEGEWQPSAPRATAPSIPPPWADDDLPRVALDEDGWAATWVRQGVAPQALWADDEIVPQPAAPTLEETEWAPRAYAVPPVVTLWAPDDEAPRETRFEDDAWKQAAIVQPAPAQPSTADDEIVPQPASFTPEEDYWLELRDDRSETVVVAMPLTGGTATGATQPTTIFGDADYWLAPQPALVKPVVTLWVDRDDAVPQTPQGTAGGGQTWRAVHKPVMLVWGGGATDELPTQATPLQVVDTEWAAPAPLVAAPVITLWAEDDQIVEQPVVPALDDGYAPTFAPVLPAPIVTLFSEAPEWPTPAVPLFTDEGVWNVYTPPYLQPQVVLPFAWGEEDTIATGIPAIPDSPLYFEIIAPPSVPTPPAYERMPRDPQVDKDFHALARMGATSQYLEDVVQWMSDELGDGEVRVDVSKDDGLEPDADLFGEDL